MATTVADYTTCLIAAGHTTCLTFAAAGKHRLLLALTSVRLVISLRAACHAFIVPRTLFVCRKQEGADVCQECDPAKPYTGSVQTTSVAGCWDEDFRSDIDMVIGGT